MKDEMVKHIANTIRNRLDISAEIDPESGKPVLVMREGTFESAAREAILEVAFYQFLPRINLEETPPLRVAGQ